MDVVMESMETIERNESSDSINEFNEPNEAEEESEFETFPPCEHEDCHAWKDGRCVALTDNDFGNRPCPFYKNRDTNHEEQKKCMMHLIVTGRSDLIKKYKRVLKKLDVFDVSDDFTDHIADELEQYSGDFLQELLEEDQSDGFGSPDASGCDTDAEESDWSDQVEESDWHNQDEGDDWDD